MNRHTTTNRETMNKLSLFLEENMGLYYPEERWADLEKKMTPALSELGHDISWLINHPIDPNIIKTLAHYLTIGETYFFRDSGRINVLEKQILPDIIRRKAKEKKIRIWSAGCCTGEEPYTLAILLDRLLPHYEEWDISIIGTDINKEFLKKAQSGNYKKWSFRTTSPEVRARYFTEHKNEVYSLLPRIKKMVNFSYSNLTENQDESTFDLILCHYVLIYFSPKQIKSTIHRFASALDLNGWLSISSIETPFVNEPHLSARNFNGIVFFQKSDKTFEIPKFEPLPFKENEELIKTVFYDFTKKEVPAPAQEEKKETDLHMLYRNKKYQEIISQIPSSMDSHENLLIFIRTYANLGEHTKALELCRKALEKDKLDHQLYYILGTIHMDQGNMQDAIKFMKNTLFLEPNFVAAHYMLGLLEMQHKNFKACKMSFKTALDLLQNFSPDEELPGAEGLTASTAKDVIQNFMRTIP